MARIVSIAETVERLDALDLASPTLDKARVEASIAAFYESLKLKAPAPQWFPSAHDFNLRLHDLDIYGSYCFGTDAVAQCFYSRNAEIVGPLTRTEEPPVLRALRRASPAASDCWHYWFIYDDNVLSAFEAGLGYFLIRGRILILVPRPSIHLHREQNDWVLHSTRGAAVAYADDPEARQWWLRGVRVRQFVVEQPERITRAHIRAASTPRHRRVMVDQYGLLRYCAERGFRPVDRCERFGATLYVRGGRDAHYGGVTARECVVELVNSTPEPDGSHRHFARRVPGNIETARQAVAWTFGLSELEYDPVIQT